MGKYRGIDYGMGQTNIDLANGIRYGVISMNALSPYAWGDVEADYGEPTCGECGQTMDEYDDDRHGDYKRHRKHAVDDYACTSCELVYGSDESFRDEPIGHILESDGLVGRVDGYNDLMLFKSPFYTFAQFCSPCAPGAGHLENYTPDGVKTYCLGADWFEDDKPPYPVYRVDDDTLVTPMAEDTDEDDSDDTDDE